MAETYPPPNPNAGQWDPVVVPDTQNNNPEITKKPDKLPFVPTPTSIDLGIILQDVSHFILKTNHSPLEIGIPYSDEALKYDVFDQDGQRLFVLCETSNYCKICCWKTGRPFVFFVLDASGRKILSVTRPFGCCCCCGVACCGDMACNGVRVNLEDGTEVGRLSQKFRCCMPVYTLTSASTTDKFEVKGPCCGFCFPCRLCCSSKFSIVSEKKNKTKPKNVGQIKEGWRKLAKVPAFSDSENFGAKFPTEWDVCQKATVLGALLLIVSYPIFERIFSILTLTRVLRLNIVAKM